MDLAGKLANIAVTQGCVTTTTDEYPVPQELFKGADACLVIGGDGSILSVAEPALRHQVPVFGINIGKLGFLATWSPEDSERFLPNLIKGQYTITPRTVIVCRSADGINHYALNDIVIKSDSTKLVELAVYANNESVNDYFADGLIFFTPTGSTAYNLSAGGPLVHNEARIIGMTPICPHTLSNRGFIFDDSTELTVILSDATKTVQVSIDGNLNYQTPDPFPISIRATDSQLLLAHPLDHSHYRLIRKKLHWGSELSKLPPIPLKRG